MYPTERRRMHSRSRLLWFGPVAASGSGLFSQILVTQDLRFLYQSHGVSPCSFSKTSP
jgi:hypothetical protein